MQNGTVSASATATGEKEMDKSDAMMESVDIDYNKQLKPRGFPTGGTNNVLNSASIFDHQVNRPASSPNAPARQ